VQRIAAQVEIEGFLADVVRLQPTPEPRLPVVWLTDQQKAAELQRTQADRAKLAARENELMLGFAADRPDDADPPGDHPGTRSKDWRVTDPEFPGISESFPHELAMVLGVGRGTAAHKLRRAWTLRHSLPATEAAQARGALDERRVQILADTLAHTDPALAGRVEAVVLPEAALLGFGQLKRRILEVLLELDPATAEENRSLADKDADVFCEPDRDGTATLGARLPAGEAAEGYDFINSLAEMAKADGDPRPIGQLRHEIFSLLVRGAAIGAAGARATLTITAALEALEGTSSRPGDVNGFAITPAQLGSLLARLEAVDLTIAVTDADGRLLATLTLTELQRAVQRGEGANMPPATDSYPPTAMQRRFVTTRDRSCRMPFCGQRVGWADHDHVVPHAEGGRTTCTNLCCLCRSHHRLKTLFKNWLFVMEDDGTLHVTTPSGVTRTSKPWTMRRPPPEPPPDPDPPPF
jgi:hypothetical protein